MLESTNWFPSADLGSLLFVKRVSPPIEPVGPERRYADLFSSSTINHLSVSPSHSKDAVPPDPLSITFIPAYRNVGVSVLRTIKASPIIVAEPVT